MRHDDVRRARLKRVLGVAVADAEVERILRALGMQVSATADGWSVLPPSRRFDIAIEEDLVEEIARIHGYETIPTTTPTGEVRLVAISPETGKAVRELGYRVAAEADVFTEDGLIDAVARLARTDHGH